MKARSFLATTTTLLQGVWLVASITSARCDASQLNCRAAFAHPGILFTSSQVQSFRSNALSGDEPWATTYQDLQANSRSSSSYAVRGPGQLIGRNTGNATIQSWSGDWQSDCFAAYLNALMYAIAQNDSNAQKVAEIVDAWSGTLEGVANADNLLTALGGRQLINAAELVRYLRGSWPTGQANFARAQTMVSSVLVPNMYAAANPPSQPVPGGNQAFLGHAVGMEFAIFTNNASGYAAELAILKQPKNACVGTEGSGLQALILNTTGQCAEAGRDQGHSGDEVGWAEEAAQVATNQGDPSLFDLVSQDGKDTPLILLAMEYYFKYNTGSSVPFDTAWGPCCCGTITYSEISNSSRGTTYPFGEVSYRYYNTGKGLAMPYTELWLSEKRPLETESNFNDFPGWPTLTWAAGAV